MIKVGMILGDRYEILERVGVGGMAEVFKGKDHKLNRFVAIKVLKEEFRENGGFIKKFKEEAQAAAALAHPNIVNVYDVGDEYGIYYIVMELVEGITLKKYIEKKARLSFKEAVSIAIQVSMGIEAAHNIISSTGTSSPPISSSRKNAMCASSTSMPPACPGRGRSRIPGCWEPGDSRRQSSTASPRRTSGRISMPWG